MPPANITGFNTSSTSIRLFWNQVPRKDKNGIIRGFFVQYWQTDKPANTTKNLAMSADQAQYSGGAQLETFSTEVKNLSIWTNYTFQVKAFTIADGNFSSPLTIRSDEDSK